MPTPPPASRSGPVIGPQKLSRVVHGDGFFGATNLRIGGIDQTAYLRHGSLTMRLRSFDFGLINPAVVPALGDIVQVIEPAWTGEVVKVEQVDPDVGTTKSYAVAATNTAVGPTGPAPFGLSDTPDDYSTVGYKNLRLAVSRTASGDESRGSCTIYRAGLWPNMTFALTSSNFGQSATPYLVSNVTITWPTGDPVYALEFGDAVPELATWMGLAIPAGSVTPTMIADGAITMAKLGLQDDAGTTVLDASGFGPTWRRFVQAGLYNSDFHSPPAIEGYPLSAINPMPFWTARNDPATTAVTGVSVIDTTLPSGRLIRWTVADSPSGPQSQAIQQTVDVAAARSQALTQTVIASFRNAAATPPANTTAYARAYYLNASGAITGQSGLTQIQLADYAASETFDVRAYPNVGRGIPADADSLFVEVGCFRRSGSTTGIVDLTDVAVANSYANVPLPAYLPPVRLATTAALPTNTAATGNTLVASANGALPTIDGTSAAVGDRILVKNEATLTKNGTYVVTALGSAASLGIAELTAQRTTTGNGTSSTITLNYPTDPTSGDLLVACLAWRGDATVATAPTGWAVAKAGGNASDLDSAIYWKIADGTERVSTWTFSASVKSALVASEWSNGTGWQVAPADKSNNNTSTGTAGTTGATGVLTQADELVVALFANVGTDTWSAYDNSAAEVGEDNAVGGPPAGRVDVAMASRIVAATTSINYGATLSASQLWSSAVATFMPAAPSGTGTAWSMVRGGDWRYEDILNSPNMTLRAGSAVSVSAGASLAGSLWIVDSARTTWTLGRGLMPPGTILAYGAAAAPTGYLLCDGTSYLRTDYAELFAAIGTTYGTADGTHFNVPNLVDKIVVGGTPGVGAGTISPTAALTTHASHPFTAAGASGAVEAIPSALSHDAHAIYKNVLVAWIIKT